MKVEQNTVLVSRWRPVQAMKGRTYGELRIGSFITLGTVRTINAMAYQIQKTQGKLLYFAFKYKGSSFDKKIICKIKTDHKGQESLRGQRLVCMPYKELYAHTQIIYHITPKVPNIYEVASQFLYIYHLTRNFLRSSNIPD